MSVKYNIVARKNPQDTGAPPKYYPSVVSSGRKDLRDLAREIAEISTLSSVDTMAALEALLVVLPRQLAEGNITELGDFGSFWLRITGEGAESKGDVSAKNIKAVKPYFRPGKHFKKDLAQIDFEKA